MEDLRLAIIVLGVFSILGILVHGLWTIRKNAASKDAKKEANNPNLRKEPELNGNSSDYDDVVGIADDDPLLSDSINESIDFSSDSNAFRVNADYDDDMGTTSTGANSSAFDEDGIGQVRTVARNTVEPKSFSVRKDISAIEDDEEYQEDSYKEQSQKPSSASSAKDESLDAYPEPPRSLLKSDTKSPAATAKNSEPVKSKLSLAERAKQLVNGGDKKEVKPSTRRVEPRLSEDQIRMDFDDQQVDVDESASAESAEPMQQEVLVLNVKVPEGKEISGASLLPALLTLGFKFGDQDVFHRHAASNGKGPKLFSLANMFKPGTFNLDEMETFKTQGVSLFMILPIEGDPQQVFNMMHNAARKLADEFGAQILDGRRSLLTKQSLRQYVEKIREFERKRMIHRA
ncbi:cell division protein ZipA [Paraneptunicella aestuarii]|uniref:cell division protein ZipA n=1 Tax=Paraneptunicella aestuarii TaxID=2831148 RepID=UPI001E62DB6A|nr:cell division protein ZipA [Paraneptunicella aestuarii]UAA40514.1 cell division protein ZipA [Paraneptunicella aestuarii]